MSWIAEVSEADAVGELKEIYERIEARRGKVSNIKRVQSLEPRAMAAHLDLYMAVAFGREGLTRAERELLALVRYALALTRTPAGVSEAHVQELRDAGLSDREILQANLVVSYFNFVNRIAEGLGVEATPEEVEGYRY